MWKADNWETRAKFPVNDRPTDQKKRNPYKNHQNKNELHGRIGLSRSVFRSNYLCANACIWQKFSGKYTQPDRRPVAKKRWHVCLKLFVLIDFGVIKVSRVAFHILNDHLTRMRPLQHKNTNLHSMVLSFLRNHFSPSLSLVRRLQFERALYHAFGIFQFEKLFILFQILIYAFMTTTTLSIDKIASIWNSYFNHRENPFREFDCNFFFLKKCNFHAFQPNEQKTELFRCQQLSCEKFKTLK